MSDNPVPMEAPVPAPMEVTKGGTRATLEIIRILAGQPQQKELLQSLIDSERARDEFDQDIRAAKVYAQSSQFDDIKGLTPEQALATCMAKIRIGRSWGMNESDSIAYIFWVNGKPAVMTEILATKIQQAGFNWDTEWHWETITQGGKQVKRCCGCTLWLRQWNPRDHTWEKVMDRNNQQVNAFFTKAEAEQARVYDRSAKGSSDGRIPLNEKAVWQAWGQDMYFWAAMRRLRKYYLTSILRGAEIYELARSGVDVEITPALPAPPEVLAPEPEPEEPKPLREQLLEMEKSGPQQKSLLES